jgi:hypothetical protein
MRYLPALVLALTVGAAASLYTPSANAGVYVGVGLPAPVVTAPGAAPAVVAGVGFAPWYYGPRAWFGPAYYGPRAWGYGHAYGYWGGYRHGYWGGGYHRR